MKKILDDYLLIATGKACGVCPDIRQINKTAAYVWELLEQHKETEEIIQAVSEAYGTDVERIRPGITAFLNDLALQHYIMQPETR